MGNKATRCITYEEAAQLLTASELQHLQRAFRYWTHGTASTATSTGSASNIPSGVLDRGRFIDLVLSDIPRAYHVPFARAMSTKDRGITYRELVCALAVYLRGSIPQRAELIFNVYDQSRTGELRQSDFEAMLLPNEPRLPNALQLHFTKEATMNFEQFLRYVQEFPKIPSLIAWIHAGSHRKPQPDRIPGYYDTLTELCSLNNSEVRTVERLYWRLRQNRSPAILSSEIFEQHACPPLTPPIAKRLFAAFDTKHDGDLDLKELLQGVGRVCRGDAFSRHAFIFEMYADGDMQKVSRDGLASLLHDCAQLQRLMAAPAVRRSSLSIVGRATAQAILAQYARDAEADALTGEEFGSWAQASNSLEPLLTAFNYLGAFVFRLRPRTHDEEAQLVSKFFELESHYPMGDMDVAFCAAADEEEQGESSTDDDVQPTTQPVQHPSKALDGDEADLDDGSTARNPIRVCYLVSHVWYQRWKRYVGLDLPAPAGSTATGELSVRPASAADSPARLPAGPSSGTVAAAAASSPSTSASRRGSQAAVSAAAAAVAATAARGPEHPGYIDNDILCLPLAMRKTFYSRWGAPLRPGMQNGRDYVVLSKTMWEALHQWYDGGPILPRPYVPAGACLMPESYLVTLRILRHVPTRTNKVLQMAQMLLRGDADEKAEKPPEVSYFFTTACSRHATLREVLKNVCRQQAKIPSGKGGLSPDNARLWDWTNPERPMLLTEDDRTLEQLKLPENTPLLLEVRNTDLSWPSELLAVARASQHGSRVVNVAMDPSAPTAKQSQARLPGVTGLSNLGNTCFMNSGLQCLSHTQPLTAYFLQHLYYGELNHSNVLGHKGMVARRYADLLKQLWTESGSVAPLKLKHTLQKIEPRFAGYQQHDAQELLNFLLDGLHEDLNRVTEKPYVERKDSDGRADEVVAVEHWANHLARNRSIIVDLFQGQIKSRLQCLHCGYTSVIFDPFTFLSLPLPGEGTSLFVVRLQRLDGSVPKNYAMSLDADATFVKARSALAKLAGLIPQQICFVDVLGGIVSRIVALQEPIRGRSVVAYEIIPQYADQPHQAKPSHLRNSINGSTAAVMAAAAAAAGTAAGAPAADSLRTLNGGSPATGRHAARSTSSAASVDLGVNVSAPAVSDAPTSSNSSADGASTTAPTPPPSLNMPAQLTILPETLANIPNHVQDAAAAAQPQTRPSVSALPIAHGEGINDLLASPTRVGAGTRQRRSATNSSAAPLPPTSPGGVSTHTDGTDNASLWNMVPGDDISVVSSRASMVLPPSAANTAAAAAVAGTQGQGGRRPSAASSASAAPPYGQHRFIRNHYTLIQRRLEQVVEDLLARTAFARVFGSPYFIPYEMGRTTWSALYESVWKQLSRFVDPVLRNRVAVSKRYPFRLTVVSMHEPGSCGLCDWTKHCLGCAFDPSDDEVQLRNSTLLSADWEPRLLHLHFLESEEHHSVNHSSVEEKEREARQPVTLEDCLKAFAKEEKLEDNELWYCSRCKAHQPAAKKLDIWALPPYLVVHLKRFHMHNGRWMKSTAHVSFPLRDLQPAKCMPRVTENTSAAKPGEANEAEAAAATKTGDISHSNGSSSPSQQQNDVGQPALAANNSGYASSEPSEATTELINSNGGPKTVSATAADHVQSNLVSGGSSGANSAESVRATVVNAAAASLTPAAGSADPPLSRELPPDSVPCGESPAFSAPFAERHYDLYAVACHEGIMGGGHYVAYALNEETGNWYFFNDSSCRKVTEEAVAQQGTAAYMLFYKCRDVDPSKLLPPPRSNAEPVDDASDADEEESKHEYCNIM